mgnify:FL=1
MSGKGSSPRPFSVDHDTFAHNWDAIFGSQKKEEPVLKDDKEDSNKEEEHKE